MSKITYVLSNPAKNELRLGRHSFPPNSQKSVTIDDDSEDDDNLTKAVTSNLLVLVSRTSVLSVGERVPVTLASTGALMAGDSVIGGGGSVGLTGLTYDGSNRCTAYTINGVAYTLTYPTGKIVVTGNDGSIRNINLDGSGRISSVD